MKTLFLFLLTFLFSAIAQVKTQSSGHDGSIGEVQTVYDLGTEFGGAYNTYFDSYAWLYSDTVVDDDGNQTTQELKANLQIVFGNQQCDKLLREEFAANSSHYQSLPGHPTRVTIQIVITNIDGLSDTAEEAALSAFIDFKWTDPRIRLAFMEAGTKLGNRYLCSNDTSPTERSYFVSENMKTFWFPLFTVDNSATKLLFFEAWEKFPGVFYPNGTVFWRSSFRFTLNCDMSFSIFPFDKQSCRILIRSPNYDLVDLRYKLDSRRAVVFWNADANSDPLWDVTGQYSHRTSGVPGVSIWLRYERKTTFYTWTLVLPTLAVSVMTMLTFVLPPNAGEKMTTVTTGVLAYFLLLLSLTSITPQVSESMPALAMFFVAMIGVGIAGAVAAACLLRISDNLMVTAKSAKAVRYMPVFFGISLNTLNTLCLLGYVLATVACYAVYLIYVYDRAKHDTSVEQYNFTNIEHY